MAKSTSSTIAQLLLTAVSMLVLPVAAFFTGRHYLFVEWSNPAVWSVVLSVSIVHLIVGVYSYVAYMEVREEETEKDAKLD